MRCSEPGAPVAIVLFAIIPRWSSSATRTSLLMIGSGNTLFFNPGYAGRSRFGMPRSVAILHSEDACLRAEFKEF
jgi:hypothetical protein